MMHGTINIKKNPTGYNKLYDYRCVRKGFVFNSDKKTNCVPNASLFLSAHALTVN